MKVLFVSAVLPYPLHSGGQIRIYNLLKRLSRKHEISLLSFIREEKEKDFLKELSFLHKVDVVYRGRVWQPRYVGAAMFGKFPLLLASYENARMKETIRQWIAQNTFDLVHIEPFYVSPSLPPNTPPLVVGEHNIEYEVYVEYVKHFPLLPIRPFFGLDVVKLRLWEERAWRRAAAITAVSSHDKDVIGRVNKLVTLVPNGVDLKQFAYQSRRPKRTAPLVLFVGDFKWLPNQQATRSLLHHIWPAVKQKFPLAKLRIIGRSLPEAIIREGKATGAEIMEDVTDIAAEYRNADMLMAPIQIAGGTKFKILEAMASGLPVITTRQGSEGLEAQNTLHYLEAQTPVQYIDQMRKIWENEKFRFTLTESARRLIEARYSWDSIAQLLDKVWRRIYEKKSNH